MPPTHLRADTRRVFDMERFLSDVRAYRAKQSLSVADIKPRLRFSRDHTRKLLMGDRDVTLYSAIVLADMADLDLNDYIRVS